MMEPMLTWLDLTAADRDKMRQLLDQFGEEATVDEMGLGTLRDDISEDLFPGTSTIQTRSRQTRQGRILFTARPPDSLRRTSESRRRVDATFGTMATLVNVCGRGRSGTTMLDLMLGHGDDAFSCGEVHGLFRPTHVSHFKPVCGCGQDPCPVWARIGGGSEHDFHVRAARELDVEFVIDSSKKLSWVVDSQDWARGHGMRAHAVVVWKSPEERAWSHWKRNGEALGWLRGYVRYHRRLIDLGVPFVTVGFRDLVEDPAGIVEALCAHLGMRHFPGKEEFWRHRSHHLFGSQGTRRQQEAGSPGIRSDPGYGAEFEPVLAEIAPVLAADADLSRILVELKARDFRRASAAPAAPFARPAVMPRWYDFSKLKRAFRRRFPRRKPLR